MHCRRINNSIIPQSLVIYQLNTLWICETIS